MTKKERALVEKILSSDYADGRPLEEMVDHEIWTFSVSDGPRDNAVIGSLTKKGYVKVSKYDKDETIWLTAAGAEAYKKGSK